MFDDPFGEVSVNYDPQVKFELQSLFVNKVFIEHSYTIHLYVVYGCFPNKKAELSSCTRNHMAHQSIYYLAFIEKAGQPLY